MIIEKIFFFRLLLYIDKIFKRLLFLSMFCNQGQHSSVYGKDRENKMWIKHKHLKILVSNARVSIVKSNMRIQRINVNQKKTLTSYNKKLQIRHYSRKKNCKKKSHYLVRPYIFIFIYSGSGKVSNPNL